jgi:hypothetical protein|tara:strand:- start:296 stop:598 length:303 start_codon:yes stop_codon:yes gene_type:complete
MKFSNNYHIEAEANNWILIQSHTSSKITEKTGKYETIEKKTYWGTLQQVVNKLVKEEVKGLDDLMKVVDSEKMIADLILKQISSDLSTGPYRLLKHGEQL